VRVGTRLALVALGSGLVSCAIIRAAGCQTDHPVAPASIRAGVPFTVASLDHPCARETPLGDTHRLVLVRTPGGSALDLGAVVVRSDGTFRVRATVPAGTRPGVVWITVTGMRDPPCHDTAGAAASCVGYVAIVRLEAP
jgi:hypothetical protein